MDLQPEHSKTTTTLTPKVPPFTSCQDAPANTSVVYLISVNNDSASINVYCEQEEFSGG